MQSISERLAELHEQADACAKDAAMCRRKAGDFEHQAMVIEAEIRGIEMAQAALQPPPSNGAEPKPERRKRRDIKALVRSKLTDDDLHNTNYAGENEIAHLIGCSPHYVRTIVKALRKEAAE